LPFAEPYKGSALGLSLCYQTKLHIHSLELLLRNHSLELLVLHIRSRFRS
jgi:hypothetical protein